MRIFHIKIGFKVIFLALLLSSCHKGGLGLNEQKAFSGMPDELDLSVMARIFAELPIEQSQMEEVYDAVSSSSNNGYDEEYMLSDMLTSPGAGVGDLFEPTKSPRYTNPLRDLLSEYFVSFYGTKSPEGLVSQCLDHLSDSDMQIYWPYSETWDGKTMPIITFDPGQGEESNYGYEIIYDDKGQKQLTRVEVTEELALQRPVWVVNRNDDSAYKPLNFFEPQAVSAAELEQKDTRQLYIKSFKALRNYDSWFGGASEFFVKCGAVNGFRAETEEEMRDYSPEITDFVFVVKRSQIGMIVPFNALLLSDYTDQMEKIAFLVTEDDGGTRTSWKCEAVVKYKSKSYGFTMDIPYNDRDDIVWRGQLASSFFEYDLVKGRFGDVEIIFELL